MTRGIRNPAATEAHTVKIVLGPNLPQTVLDAARPEIWKRIEAQAQREIEKAGLPMSKRYRVRVYKFGDNSGVPLFNATLDNGRLTA